MAKTMAVLENGTVTNMIWCSDDEPETETLIDPGQRPVGNGDTYTDGRFYRDGAEILTPLDAAYARLDELEKAYKEGVNSL